MATLARMQYNQRQTFQADSDDDDDDANAAAHNAPGPNNPDTRYQDDLLDAEEAEQERLMSERFGEAGEAPSGGEKRAAASATDQDIAAELAGEARKIKKSRPTLQPSNLIGGSNGLIRIRNEFNDMVKYRGGGVDRTRLLAKKKKLSRDQIRRAELNAAAAYSRDLVGAYRTYCHDLFPTMAFEDTVAKIETLSSKKEVKDYVELMREDARRTHLVKIFGTEKTDRMLSELESNVAHGYGDDGMDGGGGGGMNGMGMGAVANPYGGAGGDAAPADAGADEEEREMEEDGVQQQPYPPSPVRDYRGITRGSSQKSNPYAAQDSPSKDATSAADKEEEEAEATFDDNEDAVAGSDKESATASPADDEAASADTANGIDKDKEAGGSGDEGEEEEEEEEEEQSDYNDGQDGVGVKASSASRTPSSASRTGRQKKTISYAESEGSDEDEAYDEEEEQKGSTKKKTATVASKRKPTAAAAKKSTPSVTGKEATPTATKKKATAASSKKKAVASKHSDKPIEIDDDDDMNEEKKEDAPVKSTPTSVAVAAPRSPSSASVRRRKKKMSPKRSPGTPKKRKIDLSMEDDDEFAFLG
mmetsp:Transcript_19666/g.42889  ORF Transcript_19666/g.42889 Transcript_19666/m.42889 type:complete len:589 (+) Transcript_19666:126-1892(+)